MQGQLLSESFRGARWAPATNTPCVQLMSTSLLGLGWVFLVSQNGFTWNDLKDHSVPILSHRWGCQPLDQAAQATAQCGAISKLLRVHTRSHHLSLTFVSLIKTLRSSGLRMEPLGDPTLPRRRAIDHNPLAVPIQPTLYPLNALPFKSVSLQFREKDAV